MTETCRLDGGRSQVEVSRKQAGGYLRPQRSCPHPASMSSPTGEAGPWAGKPSFGQHLRCQSWKGPLSLTFPKMFHRYPR